MKAVAQLALAGAAYAAAWNENHNHIQERQTGYPPPPPTYPAPSPTALPAADSQALQDSVTAEGLLEISQDLEDIAYATEARNRVLGSEGNENSVTYIRDFVAGLQGYYDVTTQPFDTLSFSGSGNLTVDGTLQEGSDIFEYSPGGNVNAAPVVAVANLGCNATDYPAEVAGAVALISRGECEFGLKSARAGAAGAVAAIIYNNVPGAFSAGTLGQPPRPEGEYVITTSLTQEQGAPILAAVTAGTEVTATVLGESEIRNVTAFNVFAQTVGGDQDNVLQVGAHLDSVEAGPGINDDGSGTVALLYLARELSNYAVNNAIRFSWWNAEEEGLVGSTYYTSTLPAEEVAKIRLYLNFDMIASPNYYLSVYDGDGSSFNISGPPGSAEAEAFFNDYYVSRGQNFTASAFTGRSDYGGFLDVGVASGGLFTGAEGIKTEEEALQFGGEAGVAYDINYHQAGDNVTNLNLDAFVLNTQAIAAALVEYGTSFDSLPAPGAETIAKREVSVQNWKRQPKESHGAGCAHDLASE